ncbi:MAG: NAD(P)-dependent oxidoreductase [Aridibacter famidurans]|nr:NAD(P)-dependent oxidoreductase [Aridibacter famidurans]
MIDPLSEYRGARAMVLGGGGFIGLWVSRLLSHARANLVSVVRDRSSVDLLEKFGVTASISVTDLLEEGALEDLISRETPSIVFNLAGYGIDRSEKDEDVAFKLNAELVKRLCEAVDILPDDQWQGLRLVHAGTAMEYGAVSGNLEESSEAHPTTVYGSSKLAGTDSLTGHCRRSGLKGATARLFAIYGPGELPTRLLPTLVASAEGNEEIELTEGLHKRDFTYVSDAAEGLLRLGLSNAEPGSVVNVATGTLTSIREFTEIAAKQIGIDKNRLAFGALPTRPEEMFNSGVSVKKAKQLLGWIPSISVETGVRKTLEFRMSG